MELGKPIVRILTYPLSTLRQELDELHRIDTNYFVREEVSFGIWTSSYNSVCELENGVSEHYYYEK
jgi:hypothetical protein